MIVTDSKTIADIQLEFSKLFPGLKIEFYKTSHDVHEASPRSEILDNSLSIGEVRRMHKTEDIRLSPSDTVAKVENTLKDIFGLNAQIFRKSKDLWLQTSTTDDWTLEKQNTKGLESISSNTNLYNDKIVQ